MQAFILVDNTLMSTKHCIHFKELTLKPFLNYKFFIRICLSRGQCRVTHPKPKSNKNCPLLVILIQVVSIRAIWRHSEN